METSSEQRNVEGVTDQEDTFQDLIGEPVQAQGLVVSGWGGRQAFMSEVAAIVQGGIQGVGTAVCRVWTSLQKG